MLAHRLRRSSAAGSAAGGVHFVGGKLLTWPENASQAIPLTDLTGGVASAPGPGDLVIIAFGFRADTNQDLAIVTGGYTEVADLFGSDTISAQLGVFYKVMSGSPDISVTVGSTTATDDGQPYAAIHVWRGIDGTTPMDVAATIATGASSTIPNPPAITPVTAGAIIIGIGLSGNISSTGGAYTHPAFSNLVTAGTLDGCSIAIGSIQWPGSGAYDPAAFGISWSNSTVPGWCAATLALRPA